ncbi:MAG: GNAT family N-acetyltransferase [Spirochaetaceae bacterium]
MDLKVVKESILTEEQILDVKELYDKCNNHDKTGYVFDILDDFIKENDINTFLLYKGDKLVSSLCIFAPSKKEAEIIALTSPDNRKQGLFSLLLKEATIEIKRRKIESILFVSDSSFLESNRISKTLNSKYEFSEYLLTFKDEYKLINTTNPDIRIAIVKTNIDRLIQISSTVFNSSIQDSTDRINDILDGDKRKLFSIEYKSKIVGMIGIYEEETRLYIFGFCIDPEFQKKGIGKYVLSEIVKMFLLQNKEIVLEVQVDNTNALGLYQNIGFDIQTEFRYYRYMF